MCMLLTLYLATDILSSVCVCVCVCVCVQTLQVIVGTVSQFP
jgi:hypothetical protein